MTPLDYEELLKHAREYSEDINRAQAYAQKADPEAQLTVPFSQLLRWIAKAAGLGDLDLLREAHLESIRPDFAVFLGGRPCGWVELKRPRHPLDGEKWKGRERDQWKLLAQLDSLLVSDGREVVLYRTGEDVGRASLPFDDPCGWDPTRLINLLQAFVLSRPSVVRRVSQLADQLAPLARFLREKLEEGLELKKPAVLQAKQAWDRTVHATDSPLEFANDVAQVVAYSMAIAGLTGQADTNKYSLVSLEEAQTKLRNSPSNVLAAALSPVLGIPALLELIRPEVGAIERLVSAIDTAAVRRAKDPRGEPWLWFYEDFLAKYDPVARKQAGVYYTPTSVVQCQVRIVDDIITTRFQKPLGFGAPSVITLDPAAGSGTYPLAIIDHALEKAHTERGPAGVKQIAENLTRNLIAFEILPGAYAVSHLRIGQRLAEESQQIQQFDKVRVYLTDTLENPNVPPQSGLWGDALVLADEAAKARTIKSDEPITVIIGNPPYDRSTSSGGGWVSHREDGSVPLFDDVTQPARDAGINLSGHASLYNSYLYFWRWAIWKAFETNNDRSVVVSFITASSWLDGEAFLGLRQLITELCDEAWIVDLGGEGRGPRTEDNVFDIQSPVAITTLYRNGSTNAKPAKIHYRRVSGSRTEKFDTLDDISGVRSKKDWQTLDLQANAGKFVPGAGAEGWAELVPLTQIFPWQQPGMMYNRAWPVSPSRSTLRERWRALLEDTNSEVRAERYITPDSGRNIHTKVGSYTALSHLEPSTPPQSIQKIAWRPFDSQWTLDDPRLIALERPSFWQALSEKQLFLTSLMREPVGIGQPLTCSVAVPDKHYFRGSFGGKDVIAIYRDHAATQPNVPAGFLDVLGTYLEKTLTVEDLAAYTYAVMAHPYYANRYWDELERSTARIPISGDPELFTTAVKLGRELLWLQTFGQRYFSDDEQRPWRHIPRVAGIGWTESVTTIPQDLAEVLYDPLSRELKIGTGIISGVRPEVWEFAISGYRVVRQWIAWRTRKGSGKSAGSGAGYLDKIRPHTWEDEWNDDLLDLIRMLTLTVDKQPTQRLLLDQIIKGPLLTPDLLPQPQKGEQKPPKTIPRSSTGDYLRGDSGESF